MDSAYVVFICIKMKILKDWVIITVPRVGSHYLQERIYAHTNKALVLKYHEPVLQTWRYANEGLLDDTSLPKDIFSGTRLDDRPLPEHIWHVNRRSRFWSGLDINNLKVITVARDPKDLLTSDIAMAVNKEVNQKQDKIEKQSPYDFVREEIRTFYVNLYRDLFYDKRLQERVDKYTEDYLKLEILSNTIIDYNDLVSFPYEVTCAIAGRMGLEIVTDEYKPVGLDKNNFLVSSKNIPEYDIAKEAVDKLDLSKFYEAYNKIKSKCISL